MPRGLLFGLEEEERSDHHEGKTLDFQPLRHETRYWQPPLILANVRSRAFEYKYNHNKFVFLFHRFFFLFT